MPRLKREEVRKRHELMLNYFKQGKSEKEAIEAIKTETGMAMAPYTVHGIWLSYQRSLEVNKQTQNVPASVVEWVAPVHFQKPKARLMAKNCFKGSLYKIVDGGKKGVFVEVRQGYCVFEADNHMEFVVDLEEEVIFVA